MRVRSSDVLVRSTLASHPGSQPVEDYAVNDEGSSRPKHQREAPNLHGERVRSRDGCEAARDAVSSGDLYLESDSYRDALGCYLRAESLASRQDAAAVEAGALRVRMARCHLGLGDLDEARACCRMACDIDSVPGVVLAEARVVLSDVETRSGRHDSALASAQNAYDVLKASPDCGLLAEACRFLGIANAELGDSEIARSCFTESLVIYRRLGDEAGVASIHANLGVLAKRTGDLSGALGHLKKALEIDRSVGRLAMIAEGLRNIGITLFRISHLDDAEERLEEGLEISVAIGSTRRSVAIQGALGNIARVRGDWAKAEQLFAEVLTKSREHGYLRAEALALEFMGELEADRGLYAAAIGTLDTALAAARGLAGTSDVVGEVLRRRAEVLLELGRLDEAERDCQEALGVCRERSDRLEEATGLRVLGRIRYAQGEPAAAERLIHEAEATLRSIGESFELAKCALAEGTGLLESTCDGDVPLERIERRLSGAASLFDRIGAKPWAARCEAARGSALLRAGDAERARACLERAIAGFRATDDDLGVAETSALLEELDARVVADGVGLESRYAVITKGYELIRREPHAETLHRLASEIANAVSAERLVLTSKSNGDIRVAMSVGQAQNGTDDAVRFVREIAGNDGEGSFAATAMPDDYSLPSGVGSVAVLPAEVDGAADSLYYLYVDRGRSDARGAFTQSDLGFLGAAAGLLASAHRRVAETDISSPTGDAAREATRELRAAGLVTRSERMFRILADIRRLRDSRVPVLIRGESGVGKELIARALHSGGRSRTGRLVALNAGAVTPHLQESELFGHVRGSFTDAHRDREGLLAAAAGGTLLLDEVGEMSPALQVKLLRFLQSGEYRPVGETKVRTSDARVISATNKDLGEEVEAGRFRRDLLYRLCPFVIEVPPLRDRPEDVAPLMDHFLALYAEMEGKRIAGFHPEVKRLFLQHDWRENNVRELENEVRRAVVLCADGDEIELDEVSPRLREGHAHCLSSEGLRTLREEVEALERRRILEALEKSAWNRTEAARLIGMSRTG
ncbi:MAG: sigma 54-interacting transcriptional regulator, partial [Candidatus Eisenbacteria bacterium]